VESEDDALIVVLEKLVQEAEARGQMLQGVIDASQRSIAAFLQSLEQW
jgi:hypothetical protein